MSCFRRQHPSRLLRSCGNDLRMIRTVFLCCVLLSLVAEPVAPRVMAAPEAQRPPTPARPIIELEKTRFASNEEVFFWVGVTAPDDYRIPRSLWTTCRLIITRPDGTKRIDVVGWPIDGMLDRGWRGGWGLRSEPLQIGRYVLVFEFAGQRTSPYSFTVEDIPILTLEPRRQGADNCRRTRRRLSVGVAAERGAERARWRPTHPERRVRRPALDGRADARRRSGWVVG